MFSSICIKRSGTEMQVFSPFYFEFKRFQMRWQERHRRHITKIHHDLPAASAKARSPDPQIALVRIDQNGKWISVATRPIAGRGILGDFGDEARWDCSVVFWGRFMGQSSQQGLLVLCDSIAMLPAIYFPHYGTMCLAFFMIQLMPCLHLGNNNRHQVNFPQASLKHLRFEVTDEPDIPIPIWNICRTFVEDIRTCLWFKVFVVRTCLASVNGKMQSNLSAYFFARSATLKGFFANMNCHYVCEKNLVGFPRWWKPAK